MRPKTTCEKFDPERIKRTVMENGYVLLEHIGSGGNATVYRVRSVKYECDFVVKVQELDSHSAEREREAQALKSLIHKNIVELYEVFHDTNYSYMILEYCPGGTLENLVAREGPLQKGRLTSMCYQICQAVCACHDLNIAHRDIKPANILIDQYGRPKLADFGLSDQYDQPLVRSQAGSLAFMAPEIVSGGCHNPFKADTWALGVTFFYMGTGQLPWSTANVRDLINAIKVGPIDYAPSILPRDFVNLLKQMMDLDPCNRIDVRSCLISPALTLNDSEHPRARVRVNPSHSRTLAGMKFFSQSQRKFDGIGKDECVSLVDGGRSRSSAGRLSLAPSFVLDGALLPGRRGPLKQATFV